MIYEMEKSMTIEQLIKKLQQEKNQNKKVLIKIASSSAVSLLNNSFTYEHPIFENIKLNDEDVLVIG